MTQRCHRRFETRIFWRISHFFLNYFRVWIRGLGEMFDEKTGFQKSRETVPLDWLSKSLGKEGGSRATARQSSPYTGIWKSLAATDPPRDGWALEKCFIIRYFEMSPSVPSHADLRSLHFAPLWRDSRPSAWCLLAGFGWDQAQGFFILCIIIKAVFIF
jgi:hypothetical protein